MVDGHLFDKLDYIGKRLRGDSRPFGGIQVDILREHKSQIPS